LSESPDAAFFCRSTREPTRRISDRHVTYWKLSQQFGAVCGNDLCHFLHYNPGLNDEGINLNLDLLQERRDEAQVTWAAYQDRAAHYFNKTINPRKFQLGDWVLRKVNPITKDLTEGKLGPQWEGPYKVIRCHDKGAYHLIDTTGRELPRAWNAEHLKKYFM